MNDFAANPEKMKAYLRTVNLNGISESGPNILLIGEGHQGLEILKTLKGFRV